MPKAMSAASTGWRKPAGMMGRSQPRMSKVVYRSRAARAMSPHDIHELTRTSQARNEREALTGVMVYDNSQFFQWLEGPSDSVDRVMHSIRHDPRHTDINVLGNEPVETRAFAGWSMKLATPEPVLASWRREVIEPPKEIVEDLRRRPELASALLVLLKPTATTVVAPPEDEFSRHAMADKTASILKKVFLSAVIPELLGVPPDPAVAASRPEMVREAHARTRELADLLVASDQGAALELIAELHASGIAVAPLFATLFEPAARQMGDLWGEDLCTEFDVALGLCRLQTAAMFLTNDAGKPTRVTRPAVLVAPEPGELHRLGAALDGGVLRRAGWAPQCDYPSDDQALQDMVASTWFDVLDLSLSVAFRREHLLDQVTATIANARRASCNSDLVVMVGGRVFREIGTAGVQVGADLVTTTAMDVDRTILTTVNATRTPLAERDAQPQGLATAS